MKKLVFITGGLFLLTIITARDNYNYFTYHGASIYLSETGSGYGLSTNFNFHVQEFNRTFELGLMLNVKNQNISGFEFMYKHFLGFRSAHLYDKSLKPFFYYNFLYRIPAKIIDASSSLKSASVSASESNSKITTFEHFIGFGAQLKLLKQFYLEGSTGFGVYLGSRYQDSTPKTWGIHLNNYGFVPSFKLGCGFQF